MPDSFNSVSTSSDSYTAVASLILKYGLLNRSEFRDSVLSAIASSQQEPAKLERGDMETIYTLSEEYLRKNINTVTDISLLSPNSESTTRRALKRLESVGVIKRRIDEDDRRRQFVCIAPLFETVLDQYVDACAEEFKELIQLFDKHERDKATQRWKESENRFRLIIDALPSLVSYIDSHQHYLFNNKAYQDWFELPVDQISGRHMREILGESAYQQLLPNIEEALSGQESHFDGKISFNNADTRYTSGVYIPDISPTGEVNGFFVLVNDNTRARLAEQGREKSNLQLKMITDTIDDLFWISTRGVTEIVFISPSYEQLWQKSIESLMQSPRSFMDIIHPDDIAGYLKTLNTQHSQGGRYEYEYRIVREDGSTRWIHERGYPVAEVWNNKQLMAGTCTDITERKDAEKIIKEKEYLFSSMIEPASLGIYETDAEGACLYANKQWLNIAGITLQEAQGDGWQQALYEGDRSRIAELWKLHANRHEHWEMEYRFCTPEGKITWVHGTAVPKRDSAGNITGYFGANLDITVRKQAEDNLARLTRQNELILKSTGDGIYGINSAGICTFINPAALKILGYCHEELIDKHLHSIINHEHINGTPCAIGESQIDIPLLDGRSIQLDTEVFWHKNGNSFPVEFECNPIIDSNQIIGAVVVFRDISERQKLDQEIKHLASHDPLTGLPNRILFMDRLEQAMARANRENQSAALMFLDLDDFKAINDAYGHAIGDEVLQALAKRITSTLRESDTVARIGGDEFTMILNGVNSRDEVSNIAEKIINTISAPLTCQGKQFRIGVSIGISLYPEDSPEASKLLQLADQSMYQAKKSGTGKYQYVQQG